MLWCAGLEEQLARERQQSAEHTESLASAEEDLDQLSLAHQRLQQQLQVKVLDLQQTQDSLEERVRQHGQLHAMSESQLAQLRAELQSSAEAQRGMQQELAQKVNNVSGTETYSSYCIAIYIAIHYKAAFALLLSAASCSTCLHMGAE